MEIGRSIAKIRKENALTQENFAEKYNVTQQTVSNWENGRSYPDLDTIVQISEDFDISLDVLIKGDREMVREFSKKIKLEKYYKIITITIVGILVITLGIQAFMGTRYIRIKSKFYNGVEKYGFLKDEQNEDSLYHLETPDGVKYEVSDEEMETLFFGSVKNDVHDKYIEAFIDTDNTIAINANDGSKEEISYYLKLSYTGSFCNIYAIRDADDAELYSCTIYIDKKGYDYYGNIWMRQIYDDNKDQIEDTLKTLTTMWNDIYYPNK